MNENARSALCDMVRQYGRSVIDDPARCKGLLHDFLRNDRPELTILLGALSEGIPADLVTSQAGAPPMTRIALLAGKLQKNQFLAEDAARWAVESWALALGVVSADALRSRTQEAPRVFDPKPEMLIPAENRLDPRPGKLTPAAESDSSAPVGSAPPPPLLTKEQDDLREFLGCIIPVVIVGVIALIMMSLGYR